MIDIAIYELIKANSTVITEIGDDIYPGIVPEHIKGPAIRYQVDEKPEEFDSSGPESKKRADIQIDVFHSEYTQKRNIVRALKSQLHGFKGSQSGINFNLLEWLDATPLYDEKTREHRTTITLTCTYRET